MVPARGGFRGALGASPPSSFLISYRYFRFTPGLFCYFCSCTFAGTVLNISSYEKFQLATLKL